MMVEVERLPSGERRRRPKALWLWWHGEGELNLELLWRAYCRRFSVEHAIRFLKERLGWVRSKVRHPEQADRWTWLILAAYAQLLLARGLVTYRKLPWEKPLAIEKLSPYRVLRTFVTLVPLLGTPASLIGSELSSLLGSGPSLCPPRCPKPSFALTPAVLM